MSQYGWSPEWEEHIRINKLENANKLKLENYTDEELGCDGFIWNQLRVISHEKNMRYLFHFIHAYEDYIERMSGM